MHGRGCRGSKLPYQAPADDQSEFPRERPRYRGTLDHSVALGNLGAACGGRQPVRCRGTIGTAIVAGSPADGYTLLMAASNHAVNLALYDNTVRHIHGLRRDRSARGALRNSGRGPSIGHEQQVRSDCSGESKARATDFLLDRNGRQLTKTIRSPERFARISL